jgi:hypothetical protein
LSKTVKPLNYLNNFGRGFQNTEGPVYSRNDPELFSVQFTMMIK